MSLGSLEIEILNSVWKLQSIDEDMNISVKDIVDDMAENGMERAYTTVKTVMDRLSSKELLVRYRAGKKFFYKTVMDKNEMAVAAIKEISSQFFNGNEAEMMHFIETQCLDLV
ncbi:BlaI/MecI/CopY family transcriptional regulator [bacterium]|nr:BlaI/MecI/CopY family transcriptional regulator [bacterium]